MSAGLVPDLQPVAIKTLLSELLARGNGIQKAQDKTRPAVAGKCVSWPSRGGLGLFVLYHHPAEKQPYTAAGH